MNPEPLFQYLSQFTDISPPFRKALSEELKSERYHSKQVIKSEGQRENRLWFLQDGFARSYFFDDKGTEHTLHFWNSNEIIFSFAGYWKEPSPNYIELLEPSLLYSISYKELHSLLPRYQETGLILRAVVRRHYQQEFRRKRLYSLTAEQRYLYLRKDGGEIFRKAPVRMIASYLNMSRETLSRMISKIR